MGIGRHASPDPISLSGGPVTVLLVHGFTGSPAEMTLLAEALHGQGYSVEVPLLQGHGTCLEDLVPLRPQQWIEQLDQVIEAQLARGQQLVLGGLSMGSILALQAALRWPQIRALMLFSPPIESRDWRRLFAPLLTRLVTSVAKPPSDYVDPQAADRLWSYDRYPVVCSSLVLQMIARVRRQLSALTQPLLVIASRRDNVVSDRGVKQLIARVASTQKRLVWMEHSSHALTADGEWQQVCDECLRFLQEQVAP